jgi:hypothetical protein
MRKIKGRTLLGGERRVGRRPGRKTNEGTFVTFPSTNMSRKAKLQRCNEGLSLLMCAARLVEDDIRKNCVTAGRAE